MSYLMPIALFYNINAPKPSAVASQDGDRVVPNVDAADAEAAPADLPEADVPDDAIVALTVAAEGTVCTPAGIVLNMACLTPLQREVVRVLCSSYVPSERHPEQVLASLCFAAMTAKVVTSARMESAFLEAEDEPLLPLGEDGLGETYAEYAKRRLLARLALSPDLPDHAGDDVDRNKGLMIDNIDYISEVIVALSDRLYGGGPDGHSRLLARPGLFAMLRDLFTSSFSDALPADARPLTEGFQAKIGDLATQIRTLPGIHGFECTVCPFAPDEQVLPNFVSLRAALVAATHSRPLRCFTLGVRTEEHVEAAVEAFENLGRRSRYVFTANPRGDLIARAATLTPAEHVVFSDLHRLKRLRDTHRGDGSDSDEDEDEERARKRARRNMLTDSISEFHGEKYDPCFYAYLEMLH